MSRRLTFSLPLLHKELLDLSARRSTYLMRAIYATCLLCILLLLWYTVVTTSHASLLNVLGLGRQIMGTIGLYEQVGLHILLPVFCCGVFTVEKERNTLGLLFLTRLGPWTILFEKLASRMLLAGSFLLIGIPVHAFGYALGGITLDLLVAHSINLLVTSFSVIATCILCSTWCRTTTAALIASFAAIFIPRLILIVVLDVMDGSGSGSIWDFLGFCVLGINWVWSLSIIEGATFGTYGPLVVTLILAIPYLLYSALCLLFARWFLVGRAFASPQPRVLNFLRWIDRKLERDHRPRTRMVIVWHAADRLPDTKPVAWRETRLRYLPQARLSVVRLLVLLQILSLLVILQFFSDAVLSSDGNRTVGLVKAVTWSILILLTFVQSIGLITRERDRQTLNVLLSTPLKSRDIIRQKLAAVSQAIWICELPMWTFMVLQFLVDGNVMNLLSRTSMLLIYPWLVAWIAMSYSLSSKTTATATVKTLLDLLLRCFAPFLIHAVLEVVLMRNGIYLDLSSDAVQYSFALLAQLSPLTQLATTELNVESSWLAIEMSTNAPFLLLFVNTLIHGGTLLYVSRRCLSRGDKLLGRQPARSYSIHRI